MQSCGEYLVEERPRSASDDEELRLWSAVVGDDPTAFEQLVKRHRGVVASVAARLLDDPEDVADAVQETFVRAFEHRHRFQGTSSLRSWLLAITLNICRTQRRGFWRWRRFLLQEAPLMAETPPDPAALAHGQLAYGQLERAVRELPDMLRMPFMLRFFEELTGAEIAVILHWPESTVWTRIYTARRELQKKLRQLGLPEEQ